MRFSLLSILSLLTLVVAHGDHSPAGALHRRIVAASDHLPLQSRGQPGPLKRHDESAIAHLSPAIRKALEERDAAGEEYQVFPRATDRWVEGGPAHDKEATWSNGHGPGRGNCHGNQFAYTYDDGAYDWHAELAELFSNHSQKFTAFLNGANWRCIYDEASVAGIKAADKLGMLHQSHTWSHVNLTDGLTAHELDRQIELVEEALLKITGKVPAYLRPPFGETNRTILDYLRKKHAVTVVQWSDDAGDAAGEAYQDSIKMYKGFHKGENHITLNHEVKHDSVFKVAPAALKHFKKEGIKSVTVDKCLKGSPAPYKVIAKPSKRDHTWTCDGKPLPGKP